MNYQVKIGEDSLLPIPDILCQELGIQVGDILICEARVNSSEIVMTKYSDQTLNDAQIASAGNLTRVISLSEDLY
ncbi:hypothetical protein [Rosenbergiella nectarea]|uniref:hypothetical protein n=1 Tax=Rosenbergiella nectarea TaxID=988801 RepID=UPI001BDB1CD2|nr:hypothetical protein [Rosenbergiella nectarea]MBT0730153.1 hypothetical protein [Rosenbergiella nectarea subsp. apis]